jgi:hypothetical protein
VSDMADVGGRARPRRSFLRQLLGVLAFGVPLVRTIVGMKPAAAIPHRHCASTGSRLRSYRCVSDGTCQCRSGERYLATYDHYCGVCAYNCYYVYVWGACC